jgi:hypothetical protein
MRVGAATNQAVSVAVQLIATGQLGVDPKEVATYAEELAKELLNVMDGLQAAAGVGSAFAGTTTVVAPPRVTVPLPVAAAAPAVGTVASSGYNTTFSGSSKPLRLSEHPELDGWLHAQAAAVGVLEVWDNRGKPAYITALSSGSPKTPPPFRSATAGIDKSFWPPQDKR